MQEAELLERIEHLFAAALVRTYQSDALIDFYRVLREIWRYFKQSADRRTVRGRAGVALRQSRDACLSFEIRGNLTGTEREIVRRIQNQCGQLEEEIVCGNILPGFSEAARRR